MANRSYVIQGFWEKVEQAVYESGKSKTKIAELMDRDRKILYQSHNTGWNTNTLMKFCGVTGVSADWLLGLSEVEKHE